MKCLDYGRSFICHPPESENAVRFWVESRTTIVDEDGGKSTDYYQCGSCKSEDTFAPKDLFLEDNYDFLPIYGDGDLLVFRRRAYLNDNYREITGYKTAWGKPILKLVDAEPTVVLDTPQKVLEATLSAVPIVARTEIRNSKSRLRAVMEYPVKTMNTNVQRGIYQVDTGPVAFPDLERVYESQIDCLSLAFVAFNRADSADFVIEQPTPVMEQGKEITRVYHYSARVTLKATNTLLSAGAV